MHAVADSRAGSDGDLVSENDHVCSCVQKGKHTDRGTDIVRAHKRCRQRHIAHTRRMPATDVPANRMTLAFFYIFFYCYLTICSWALAK